MAESGKKLGKAYKGQAFVPVKTEADVKAEMDAQKPFDKPGAISLETYFAIKGIRNPVMQAGMRAYTTIRRATVEDWAAIFATY